MLYKINYKRIDFKSFFYLIICLKHIKSNLTSPKQSKTETNKNPKEDNLKVEITKGRTTSNEDNHKGRQSERNMK